MKKFLFLGLIFSVLMATTTNAQTAGGPSTTSQPSKEVDHAAILKQAQEKVVPQMVEKTGLTEVQAKKVVEILYEMRQGAAALQNLSAEERSAKLAELKATKDKKFSELLTADQITAVKNFYAEMGNAQQKKN
jgi:polyhydroxyalkanoate synthesis regulator phasin